ncbi:hypothetical protein K0G17_19645 [Bacteroides fragilis]|nr:hypothetical protein [Bacteroides fragilis]
MSLRSPKHKYSCTATFAKCVDGIGQSVTVSGDTIEDVEHLANEYKNYHPHICICENKAEYPQFDWVEVKEYNI